MMRDTIISKKNIHIAVDKNESINPINNAPCCWGEITIQDHQRKNIPISVSYWSLDNYKTQWKEGLERIKTHDSSCLIMHVEQYGKKHTQHVDWYLLYRQGKKVLMQHRRFFDASYKKHIGQVSLTPQNCYDFIPEYDPFNRDQHTEIIVTSAKKIKVVVTDDLDQDIYGKVCVIGKIKIGAYSQKINIPINFLPMDMYEDCWQEAIERIETHDSSCIVTRIMKEPYPLLEWWLLYKKDGKIIAHNDFIFSYEYTEKFGDMFLTPDDCYHLMPTYEEHMETHRMKEWIIDLDDL